MQNRGTFSAFSSHSLDTSLPQPSSIRQIDALQLLRAIAVSLVVWCHAGQILDASGSHGLPGFGVFGIDIFFVISGFILSLTVLRERGQPGVASMSEFMKRRVIRIYPIYWFVALLVGLRLTLSHRLFQHNYVAALLLVTCIHYPSQYFIVDYSWTMNFEMFFYLLLGMILLKTIKRAVPVLIAILTAFIATGFVVGIRHPVAILVANPILLEFVFGAFTALVFVRVAHRRSAGMILTSIGVIASVYLAMRSLPAVATGQQMILADQGVFARVATWGVCAALIVGGVVFWSPAMKSRYSQWSILIGNSSYSAYLVSALVLEYSSRLFFKFERPPVLPSAIRLLFESCMVVSVVAAGLVCYNFVEKPMLRFLQHRLLHSQPRRTTAHAIGILAQSSASDSAT